MGLAACDTGDGKTLRPPTEPLPTTTTSSTVAPPNPMETASTLATTTTLAPAGFRLLTPWADGGPIGDAYTCAGADESPPLSWTSVPDGAAQLAVVFVDLDATDDAGAPFVHWVVTSVDPSVSSFAGNGLPPGAVARTNDFGEAAYGGPCPPEGETHRYELTVHALNQALDVADDTPTAEVVGRIGELSIGSATVVGTFTR